MKLFCSCTSIWVTSCPVTSRNITTDRSQKFPNFDDDMCPECKDFPWYDADYENWMFDLKEMNKQ